MFFLDDFRNKRQSIDIFKFKCWRYFAYNVISELNLDLNKCKSSIRPEDQVCWALRSTSSFMCFYKDAQFHIH